MCNNHSYPIEILQQFFKHERGIICTVRIFSVQLYSIYIVHMYVHMYLCKAADDSYFRSNRKQLAFLHFQQQKSDLWTHPLEYFGRFLEAMTYKSNRTVKKKDVIYIPCQICFQVRKENRTT